MLKWLVTKHPSDAEEQVFTDDPFATLSRKGAMKNEVIYSVSRVNPLYDDEDGCHKTAISRDTEKEITRRQLISSSPPESPPTDRESVKSSGYGSKEADSVSYQSDTPDSDDRLDNQLTEPEQNYIMRPQSADSPGTVSQLRKSFENLNGGEQKLCPPQFEILQKNPNYVHSIELDQGRCIPLINISDAEIAKTSHKTSEQHWPKVSHLAEALKRQTERISQRRAKEAGTKKDRLSQNAKSQILRFNPLVSVVAQDRRYVTGISVSPNSKNNQESKNNSTSLTKVNTPGQTTSIHFEQNDSSVPTYFKAYSTNNGNEYPLLSLQPDSLITEDTLKMMNYPEFHFKSRKNSNDSNSVENYSTGELPVFSKTIYSGFYSGTHADYSKPTHDTRSSASSTHSTSAKKKGASVVKDLWEKSGLKTNGRKFLVDVNELLQKSGQLPETGKPTVYDEEKVFSVSHYIGCNPNIFHSNAQTRPESRRFSNNFDDNAYSSSNTDSSSNYERVIDCKHGTDNCAFTDDNGRLHGYQFKSKPNFHNNLTNFQKKVTDRMLSEPSHRKSWVDLKNPVSGNNYINNISVPREHDVGKKPGKSKHKHYPGKVIRDLGLEDRKEQKATTVSHYGRPWNSSMGREIEMSDQMNRNNDERKRYQFWDYHWKSSLKDASLSSFFSPHPNCGAIYERGADMCHDFTLDAFKMHRLSSGRAKRKYRRRCLMMFLIFVALICFFGAIVGISWYLTNGQKLFGAMSLIN